MTQLQICITFQKNKFRVEINKLQREDASKEEIFIAQKFEEFILGAWQHIAKDAGLTTKIKKIVRPPKTERN